MYIKHPYVTDTCTYKYRRIYCSLKEVSKVNSQVNWTNTSIRSILFSARKPGMRTGRNHSLQQAFRVRLCTGDGESFLLPGGAPVARPTLLSWWGGGALGRDREVSQQLSPPVSPRGGAIDWLSLPRAYAAYRRGSPGAGGSDAAAERRRRR